MASTSRPIGNVSWCAEDFIAVREFSLLRALFTTAGTGVVYTQPDCRVLIDGLGFKVPQYNGRTLF